MAATPRRLTAPYFAPMTRRHTSHVSAILIHERLIANEHLQLVPHPHHHVAVGKDGASDTGVLLGTQERANG